MFSAFWHGVFPSYYISFFIANTLITIEKRAYIKNIPFMPTFLYFVVLDSVLAIFKAFNWATIKIVLFNVKYHLLIILILYLWTKFSPNYRKAKAA